MNFFSKSFAFLLFFNFMLVSCFHRGDESKYVKFDFYELATDGNDGDSNFFYLHFKNNSNHTLKDPYLRMVIKDTSSKIFKPRLFSDSETFTEIPANTAFTAAFYAGSFQFGDDVGKIKIYLSWTNHKGKKGVRRVITN